MKLVLYSKFRYGSQFSEEKNSLEICSLVLEILSKKTFLPFFETPCMKMGHYLHGQNNLLFSYKPQYCKFPHPEYAGSKLITDKLHWHYDKKGIQRYHYCSTTLEQTWSQLWEIYHHQLSLPKKIGVQKSGIKNNLNQLWVQRTVGSRRKGDPQILGEKNLESKKVLDQKCCVQSPVWGGVTFSGFSQM